VALVLYAEDGSAFLALVSNLGASGPLTKHTVEARAQCSIVFDSVIRLGTKTVQENQGAFDGGERDMRPILCV
jgi:hypothetical protein